ncbi:hypothetical protein J6590_005507 [Homalodisca vitripennis]|nr:hypothetical protein J6590_005507 [Homalodisca vitripennis]
MVIHVRRRWGGYPHVLELPLPPPNYHSIRTLSGNIQEKNVETTTTHDHLVDSNSDLLTHRTSELTEMIPGPQLTSSATTKLTGVGTFSERGRRGGESDAAVQLSINCEAMGQSHQ